MRRCGLVLGAAMMIGCDGGAGGSTISPQADGATGAMMVAGTGGAGAGGQTGQGGQVSTGGSGTGMGGSMAAGGGAGGAPSSDARPTTMADGGTPAAPQLVSVHGSVSRICGLSVKPGETAGALVCSGITPNLGDSDPRYSDLALSADYLCARNVSGAVKCSFPQADRVMFPDKGPNAKLYGGGSTFCLHAPGGEPWCVFGLSTASEHPIGGASAFDAIAVGVNTVCGITSDSPKRVLCSDGSSGSPSGADVAGSLIAISGDTVSSPCWSTSNGMIHCGGRFASDPNSWPARPITKMVGGREFFAGISVDGAVVAWPRGYHCNDNNNKPIDSLSGGSTDDAVIVGTCDVCTRSAASYECSNGWKLGPR